MPWCANTPQLCREQGTGSGEEPSLDGQYTAADAIFRLEAGLGSGSVLFAAQGKFRHGDLLQLEQVVADLGAAGGKPCLVGAGSGGCCRFCRWLRCNCGGRVFTEHALEEVDHGNPPGTWPGTVTPDLMSAMKIPGMLLSSVVRVAIICVGIERAIHQTISDGR